MITPEYTLAELASHVDAKLEGNGNLKISGLATLQSAGESQLGFLANPKYAKHLAETGAGAVILSDSVADQYSGNKLIISDPYLAYAKLSLLWAKNAFAGLGDGESRIDPSAKIDKTAKIGSQVVIGPGAVISAGAEIGDKVSVGANTVIGEDSIVGAGTNIGANVTLYHGVSIGLDCIIIVAWLLVLMGLDSRPLNKVGIK